MKKSIEDQAWDEMMTLTEHERDEVEVARAAFTVLQENYLRHRGEVYLKLRNELRKKQ